MDNSNNDIKTKTKKPDCVKFEVLSDCKYCHETIISYIEITVIEVNYYKGTISLNERLKLKADKTHPCVHGYTSLIEFMSYKEVKE